MRAHIKTALIVFCVLLGVSTLITWYDMRSDMSAAEPAAAVVLQASYHAGPGMTPETLPDNNLPVKIRIGAFSYTPQDKTVFTPEGMAPATIVPRQISLEIAFKNLPRDPAETVQEIQELIDAWEAQGDNVIGLFTDYRPEQPDFKAYAALLKALHDKFKLSHNRAAAAELSWPESFFSAVEDDVAVFLIHLTQAKPSPADLVAMQAFKHSFFVQLPRGVMPEEVDIDALRKIEYLAGIVYDLDPAKPWPNDERKIGLFPKF